jgi:hypothetical protein
MEAKSLVRLRAQSSTSGFSCERTSTASSQ